MNKQSNVYTTIYIIVLVLVVGTALAAISLALKPRQQQNEDNDKRRQILAAVHLTPAADEVAADFEKYIVEQLVVNSKGEPIEGDAFTVNMAEQIKLPDAERQLPVFVCRMTDGSDKYILPAYGAGLWGPIWGYIAIDSDGSTFVLQFLKSSLERDWKRLSIRTKHHHLNYYNHFSKIIC